MGLFDSTGYALRPGVVGCACALPASEDASGRSDRWRLAASFGCAIIAQALLLTSLPIVATVIAPSPWLAKLPYALTWLGAALASFPASILIDQFGRRAAFALGASTGLAGGLVAGCSGLGPFLPPRGSVPRSDGWRDVDGHPASCRWDRGIHS